MTETITSETEETQESTQEEPGPVKPRFRWLKRLFIGLLISGVAATVAVSAMFLRDTRAVDHHFEVGNKRYDLAFNHLEIALQALAEVRIEADDPEALKAESEVILERIPKAQLQLEKAREQFEDMRAAALHDWEKKTATLAQRSVREAEKGTDELTVKIQQLAMTADLLAKVREGSEKFNDGFVMTNVAINAGNEDNFEDAEKEAIQAAKLFTQAKSLLAQANEMVLDSDLTDVGIKISRAQRWAEGAERMMRAGLENETDVYNRLAVDNNRLSDEVTDIAKHPVLSHADKWMRDKLEDHNARIQTAFTKADEFREESLDLWEKNI